MNIHDNPVFVILLFICLAGGAPLLIWGMLRNIKGQVDVIKRTGRSARHPFKGEDDQLKELNQRVKELEEGKRDRD